MISLIPRIIRFSWVSLSSLLSISTALDLSPVVAANITNLQFLGQGTIDAGELFEGTVVGGLSGLTYSGNGDRYYSISDDGTNPRFYSLNITVDSGIGTVTPTIQGVTLLRNNLGNVLGNNTTDPEGIALLGNEVYISSEGIFNGNLSSLGDFATLTINPFVNRFNLNTGNQNLALTLPTRYTTTNSTFFTGLRSNLSLESLTITPDQSKLFTAIEGPLKEDQSLFDILPASQLGSELPPLVRLLEFDEIGGNYTAGAEYVYQLDSLHGLVDLVALDDDTLLALERANLNEPHSIKLYELSLTGATNVSSNNGLIADSNFTVVSKNLLLDFSSIPGNPLNPIGNFEGLSLGSILPNGDRLLFAVSDNNFNSSIPSKFAAFALETASQQVPEPSAPVGLLILGLGLRILPKKSKSE